MRREVYTHLLSHAHFSALDCTHTSTSHACEHTRMAQGSRSHKKVFAVFFLKENNRYRKFWRSLRRACLGKPRVLAKSRSKCEGSTQTQGRCLRNVDGLREDAHLDMDAIYGFIDAGGIAHGSELRKEFEKYSRTLTLKTLKVCLML